MRRTRLAGVAAESSLPMAVMIASGGISAALLANWTLRAGLKRSIAAGEEVWLASTGGCSLFSSWCGIAFRSTCSFFYQPTRLFAQFFFFLLYSLPIPLSFKHLSFPRILATRFTIEKQDFKKVAFLC